MDKRIKTKFPKLKNPQLIAVWPGMGEVALRAGYYLRDELKPKEFLDFRAPEFFNPTGIWVKNKLIDVPKVPSGRFYYWINPNGKWDLVIFLSEAQPNLEQGYEYAHRVLDVAEKLKIKKIFTFAAMPISVDHIQPAEVWVTATHKGLLKELNQYNVKIMADGQISGLNGLLLGAAKERGMEGVCLLGEIPVYAIQIENPKASLAVLRVLTKSLNIEIDMKVLEKRSKYVEDEIGKLVDYLRASASGNPEEPIGEEDIERIKKGLAAYTKLPESAKKNIEKFFEEAKRDISKANKLKEELDKWNVYKEYEDRFLDLFKKEDKKDN